MSKPESQTTFPPEYKWGGYLHSALLSERQDLLSKKFNFDKCSGPFNSADWVRLQSIRGILDAIEEHRELGHG